MDNNVEIKDIITENRNVSRIYGLPKIRKIDIPLRPVVACIKTPTYFLAEKFHKILENAFPKPLSFVKKILLDSKRL